MSNTNSKNSKTASTSTYTSMVPLPSTDGIARNHVPLHPSFVQQHAYFHPIPRLGTSVEVGHITSAMEHLGIVLGTMTFDETDMIFELATALRHLRHIKLALSIKK